MRAPTADSTFDAALRRAAIGSQQRGVSVAPRPMRRRRYGKAVRRWQGRVAPHEPRGGQPTIVAMPKSAAGIAWRSLFSNLGLR